MAKPVITSTYCGFPDMLVDRILNLWKMDYGTEHKALAREHLDRNGITVLNFGAPREADFVGDDYIVEEMRITLRDWAYVSFFNLYFFIRNCINVFFSDIFST
jgi:hypothetical protein